MKHSAISLLILIIILLIGAGLTKWFSNQEPLSMAETTYEKNQYSPPNFSYETITGKTGALFDHKDKVVIVHFWATWCAPCIEEFPDLINLATTKNKNLVILAISKDLKTADIDKFLKKIGKTVPDNFLIIQDENNRISKPFYETKKLPETFIFTYGMSLARKITGPEDNWNSEEWQNKIQFFYDLPH